MGDKPASFADELRRLNRENAGLASSIQSSRDELARIYEAIEASRISTRQIAESFSATPRVMFAEHLRQIASTRLAIQTHLDECAEAMRVTSEAVRASQQSSQVLSAQRALSEQVAQLAVSAASQVQISNLADVFEAAQKAMLQVSERLNAIQGSPGALAGSASMKFKASGTLVDATEVPVEGVLPHAPVKKWRSIQDMRESFYTLPLHTQLFLLTFIFYFLRPLVEREMTDRILGESDQGNVTVIINEAREYFGDEDFGGLRCVKRGPLHVREQPDKSAHKIDRLLLGHYVEQIRLEGGWSFVRYVPKGGGEMKTGWVATSHLSKELCSADE